MVRPAAPALEMSSAQRDSLATIARSQSAAHRQVQRARALLLARGYRVAMTRTGPTIRL